MKNETEIPSSLYEQSKFVSDSSHFDTSFTPRPVKRKSFSPNTGYKPADLTNFSQPQLFFTI